MARPRAAAVDSFKALHDLCDQPLRTRTVTYDLAVQMASWGATTLLVGEYTAGDAGQLPEFAIADGIVRLGTAPHDLTRIRELEIQKLRGSRFVPGIHLFEIGEGGIAFFPRVSSPAAPAAEPPPGSTGAPLSTGVAQLDALLGWPARLVPRNATGRGARRALREEDRIESELSLRREVAEGEGHDSLRQDQLLCRSGLRDATRRVRRTPRRARADRRLALVEPPKAPADGGRARRMRGRAGVRRGRGQAA